MATKKKSHKRRTKKAHKKGYKKVCRWVKVSGPKRKRKKSHRRKRA